MIRRWWHQRQWRLVKLELVGYRTPRHGTVAVRLGRYYGDDLPGVYVVVAERLAIRTPVTVADTRD